MTSLPEHNHKEVGVRIDLCTEDKAFQQLGSDWNELLRDSHADTIFLTWEWIHTWWQTYGNKYKLCVVTMRDSTGRLLAIAPLKLAEKKYFGIYKLPVLEFIGFGEDVTPEYLDIIIRKGYETTLTPFIIQYILEHIDCEIYDLRPFASNSPNISLIRKVFDRSRAFYEIREHSICPVLYLPESWDEFLFNKSENFRKKMKEYSRICRRDLNIKLIRSGSMENLTDRMNQLIKLHHDRWNGSSDAFKTQEYIDFHKQISALFLKRDWLRLYFLMNDTEPIAGIYCFCYKNQYLYYQSGRNLNYSRYRTGLVLINEVVREAINEGAELFDFLSGDEPYKFRWAESAKKNIRIICWKDAKKYISSKYFYALKSVFRKRQDLIRLRSVPQNCGTIRT